MGKRRVKNKHLPSRVYFQHGAYYFISKQGKWIRLGTILSEAMTKWAEMVEPVEYDADIYTMRQLFDRYMIEVAPTKADSTYEGNKKEVKSLYEAFGSLRPDEIKPTDVYKFLDRRGKVARSAANHEKALLSNVFSMAIRWGIVLDNPCKNVKKLPIKPRDHYITHEQYEGLCRVASERMKCVIDFAYVTGLRQGDILKVKLDDLKETGIFAQIGKTGKKVLIEWTPALRDIVERAIACSRKLNINTEFLFPNEDGNQYTTNGFRANWRRLMERAIGKNKDGENEQPVIYVTERFRFHDIRRKTATDLEHSSGREKARKLLGHASQKMTGHYISGVQKVKPLK